jgi:hypothetical protein
LYGAPVVIAALHGAGAEFIAGLRRSQVLVATDAAIAVAVQVMLLGLFARTFLRNHPRWARVAAAWRRPEC